MLKIIYLLLTHGVLLCHGAMVIKTSGGVHFDYVIEKKNFFVNGSNIKFSAALSGLSDLPNWINMIQDDGTDDAVLYGTPSRDDIGSHELEIVGLNKETYNTAVQKLMFTVNYYDILSVLHQYEFLVKNKDITDMFQEGGHFLRAVQQIWNNAKYITLMEKVSQRSPNSKPLPGSKEGVHIQIGGPFKPSQNLNVDGCEGISADDDLQKVMKEFGFDIDWCKSKYITGEEESNNFDVSDGFYATSMDTEMFSVSQENHILDVAYCFLPLIIGISLIVILTCVMCFNGDGEYVETESTVDGSISKYVPLSAYSSDTAEDNGKLAYGDFSENQNNTLDQSKHSRTLSRPPPYKMPPTKIPVDVYKGSKNMVVDTGI